MKRHTLYMCPVCLGHGGTHGHWGGYDECPGCEETYPEWLDRVNGSCGMATLTMMGIINPKRPHAHKGRLNRRFWKREYLKAMEEQRYYAEDPQWVPYDDVRAGVKWARREYETRRAQKPAA